ncbi:MAG: hypothetical protein QNJ30_03805 [Kiloniellales bacterium]|nr:hypothetical protein [Kiloniellales bacterium]
MYRLKHAVIAAALALPMATAASAQEGGFLTQNERAFRLEQAIERKFEPTLAFKEAEHVINGVALRNRIAGTIHLRGVPQDRRVLRALLYWNFSNQEAEGRDALPILFNGNNVRGQKVADNADPCWGLVGNHSYRADVTRFVPQADPNQDYRVVPVFNEDSSTTGQNPWRNPEAQDRRLEGAWLVVIYNSAENPRGVAIYDDLSGTTSIGQDLAFFFAHPGIGPDYAGLFSLAGADGQRGAGNDNLAANERTFFNGNQIAGPFDPDNPPFPVPLSASDWDGSDGWPLNQLADTHTHQVELRDGGSEVKYLIPGDCVTPVAFVIEGSL